MTKVAVVTVAHGRHAHLAGQRATLAMCRPSAHEHVVVALSDDELVERGVAAASLEAPADGLPLAAGRNLGAEVALANGADVLVFLDVDCLAGPELVQAYADAVTSAPGTVWSGPVTYLPPPPAAGYDLGRLAEMDDPHPARPAPGPGDLELGGDPDLFWSSSFAVSADAWRATGGFCEEYVGYGGEDTDFARVALSSGLALGWTGSARAYHQWHPVSSPPVEHVVDIVRNAEVFRRRWGVVPMQGWLDAFRRDGLVVRDDQGRWHLTEQGATHPDVAPPVPEVAVPA